jgi:dienelactone hydrolase
MSVSSRSPTNPTNCPVTDGPVFEGVPPAAMTDTPLAVRLRGLEPGARIVIRLGGRNRLGGDWEAAAEFIADAEGAVDLATMAPVAGSYAGVDPMGLFWSRRRVQALTHPVPEREGGNRIKVCFYAELGGEVVATAEHERLLMAPTYERVRLPAPWEGVMYRPLDGVPRKAVLAVGGSSGALFWSDNFASILAAHGYVTVALAYFNMRKLPKELYEVPLEYFETFIDWLQAQPECLPGGIAVAGTSRGSEAALLLGSMFPAVRAVVAFSPTHLVWPGPDWLNPRPSWLYRGKPLPFMPNRLTEERWNELRQVDPCVLRSFFDYNLQAPEYAVEAATIPVERLNGPLFLAAGGKDDIWDATSSIAAIRQRLEEKDFRHACEAYCYPEAGHRIIWPYEAVTESFYMHGAARRHYSYGGGPAADAAAAVDVWPRLLRFLEQRFAV